MIFSADGIPHPQDAENTFQMSMDSSVQLPPSSVNPLVPATVGALLAEEWTIDPQSTLPSFLERKMMEETQKMTWETLKTLCMHLEDRLDRWSFRFGQSEEDIQRSWKNRLAWWLKIPQLLRFLSHRVLARHSPEIRFLMVYWLERKSLTSRASASLAEALHGGKRVKLSNQDLKATPEGKLEPMMPRDGIRLALLLALGRYLGERGEAFYRQLQFPGTTVSRLPRKYKEILKFLYPFLYSTAKGTNLFQKWMYLLGQSVFFDPYSRWLSLVLRRVTEEDAPPSAKPGTEAGQASSSSTTSSLSPFDIVNELASFLGWKNFYNENRTRRLLGGLVASVVGIQWLARLQRTRQKIRRRLEYQDETNGMDDSHNLLPTEVANVELIRDCPPTHCPLCRSLRINPTASTGGFVFCLACLTQALKKNPVCPVTGKECLESSIVRIFEPGG